MSHNDAPSSLRMLAKQSRNGRAVGILRLHPDKQDRKRPVHSVTHDLSRRVSEHKQRAVPSCASRYNVDELVYYEIFDDPVSAITREKQIKSGTRAKKLTLINALNPEWKDLSHDL